MAFDECKHNSGAAVAFDECEHKSGAAFDACRLGADLNDEGDHYERWRQFWGVLRNRTMHDDRAESAVMKLASGIHGSGGALVCG